MSSARRGAQRTRRNVRVMGNGKWEMGNGYLLASSTGNTAEEAFDC